MNSVARESEHQQSLNEQLRNKYHLKVEPFGDAAHLFFQGAQRQHNLETLRHLVNFGDMVLLLTGDSGSGKTTLIRELGKHVVDDVNVVSLKPSLISSSRKLVSELCKKFNVHLVDGEPVERSMDRVIQHFIQEASTGKRTLLVVDDAHETNKESFQLLISTFKHLSNDAGVCLLISGRKDVLHSITSDGVESDNCSWIHQIQLKPFSLDDALTYVSLRLIRAGASAEPDLSGAQQKALHELGKGCPGRINRIAPAVLLDVFGASEIKKRNPKGLSWLLAGISASLLISFLIIAYQYNLFSDSSEGLPSVDVVEPHDDRNVGSDVLTAREKLAEIIAHEKESLSPTYSSGDEVQPSEAISESLGTPVLELPEEPKEKLGIVVIKESAVEEVRAEILEAKVEVSVAGSVVLPVAPEKESVPKVEPKKVEIKKVNKVEKAEVRHSGFRTEAWVNKQLSSAYTIQVLGSRSEETAIKYIDKTSASASLLYVGSTYKGGAWFVVISGIYPDKSAARKALASLPAAVKKQKPWLRSVKGLQNK